MTEQALQEVRESQHPQRGPAAGTLLVFVAVSPKFGGTEKHLLELLARAPQSAKIVILSLGADVFSERLGHLEHVELRVLPKTESMRELLRLFQTVRGATVILVKSWAWCFPWYTLLAARLAGVRKRRAIAHLPPSPPAGSSFGQRLWYRFSHKRLSWFCQSTICVSDFIRSSFVDQCGFPADRTITIRNGVKLSMSPTTADDRAAARNALALPDDRAILLCIASLVDQKRVDVLLESLAVVAQAKKSFHCMVVGEGPLLEDLVSKRDALGLQEHVSFRGFHSDVRTFLDASDLFVLTSDTEGLPLSVLEAMACGLPCVVTDVGGNAEAVAHNQTGLVVPRRSPAEVAAAIIRMIDRPEQLAQMRIASRRRVDEHFDLERSMSAIWKELLA